MTTLNISSDLEVVSAIDMRQEIAEAFGVGRENAIEYRRINGSGNTVEYVYFPQCGRGGVCEGGNTEWTDCTDLDDLADRWENYDDLWIN